MGDEDKTLFYRKRLCMTTMHDACFLQENIYDSWKNHEKPKKEWKKANRFAVF